MKVVSGNPLKPALILADGSQEEFPFYFAFERGERVLDVGCGKGEHLRELVARGCEAVGIDVDAEQVRKLQAEGLPAVAGAAEKLPFESNSFDGVISSVAIPYTDERRAIAEWARVLKPGGRARASFHGVGFALEYIVERGHWKRRFYGSRQLANTWYYQLFGRRLPGFLGDSLCESSWCLKKYYRQFGLQLEAEYFHRGLGGYPRFIYHELVKR